VSLRGRAIAYLIVLHAIFAAVAVYLLLDSRIWLIAIEVVFALSLLAGIQLSREMYRHLGMTAEGLRLIREQEFTSRFLPVGQPEIDELIGIYNTMVDRLRAERVRVAEQHQFLSQVLQVSPSGVVILDFDGAISSLNPAAERLLDCPAAAAVGRRLEALATPLADALAALGPGAARLVGMLGARRVKCHHGTFIDRGFTRSFLLIEELTEELRQFERAAYEKLIRVMSHEVNNSVAASNSLLHSSLAYAGELEANNRLDFEQAIGIVIERTEQLGSFMRRFADVFRLPPPMTRPCDLLPILQGIVRLLSANDNARGVRWVWEVDRGSHEPPVFIIEIDRGQMEQALLNILKNAVEAIDGEGTVTIGLTASRGRTILTIDDTGPGISTEAQANLFTPFFSTKPHGQGIGLTLIQEILSAHGFEYGIERTHGMTRFTVVATNPKSQAPSSNHSQLPTPKPKSQFPNPNDAQTPTPNR
jgi:nitrogen fixation/metabolism regulation signal transduction histidine kinase